MPLYEVIEKTFLDFGDGRGARLVKPGVRIDFNGWPNAALNPIDDTAVETVDQRDAARGKFKGRLPDTPKAAGRVDENVVAIPSEWRSAKPIDRLKLAKKINPKLAKSTKVAEADAVIEAEANRRAGITGPEPIAGA